jgi:hypothetical protein
MCVIKNIAAKVDILMLFPNSTKQWGYGTFYDPQGLTY